MTRAICIAHGGDLSDPSGGTDRVSALASGLQSRSFDISLVVPEPGGSLPDSLDDVSVHSVEAGRLGQAAPVRAAKIARRASRIAEQRGATLQIEHSTLAGIATLFGISDYVLDMHDLGYARYDHVDTPLAPALKRGVRWLERRALSAADRAILVSEHMTSTLSQWGLTDLAWDVVPNGYVPERIEPHLDVPEAEGRVVFMGTLHPKVDVEAFRALSSLDCVSEVLIVGDGAQRGAVDNLASERESIRAPGRLPNDEAFELLSSAAVAVNPQEPSSLQRSSSPVKLYYYAALGLPMVVAPGPSVVEDLVAADAAITASDSTDVAAAVGDLLSDDERRQELGRRARDRSRAFRWSSRIDSAERIYRESISQS